MTMSPIVRSHRKMLWLIIRCGMVLTNRSYGTSVCRLVLISLQNFNQEGIMNWHRQRKLRQKVTEMRIIRPILPVRIIKNCWFLRIFPVSVNLIHGMNGSIFLSIAEMVQLLRVDWPPHWNLWRCFQWVMANLSSWILLQTCFIRIMITTNRFVTHGCMKRCWWMEHSLEIMLPNYGLEDVTILMIQRKRQANMLPDSDVTSSIRKVSILWKINICNGHICVWQKCIWFMRRLCLNRRMICQVLLSK